MGPSAIVERLSGEAREVVRQVAIFGLVVGLVLALLLYREGPPLFANPLVALLTALSPPLVFGW